MRRSALLLGCCLAAAVPAAGEPAPGAFPWTSPQVLQSADGGTLTWTVEAGEAGVTVKGVHPRWSVAHFARRDGTPVSTVKRRGQRTDRVDYEAGRVEVVSKEGERETRREILAEGLWDPGTLEARLAGVQWAQGTKLKLKMFDPDTSSTKVYPFVAEHLGVEECGAQKCHHVKVELEGWRKQHGPTYHFWFGTGPGAPYLKFSSAKESFEAAKNSR